MVDVYILAHICTAHTHTDTCAYAITRGGPCTVGNSRHDLGPRELRRRLPRARRERASVNYMFAVSARITRYNRNYEPALCRVWTRARFPGCVCLCVRTRGKCGCACVYVSRINTIYISASLISSASPPARAPRRHIATTFG